MSITLTTEEPERKRLNEWTLYWFHKTDLDANYPADEATLEQAGFVRASRLAAAEAEVERGMGIAQGQQIGYEVQLSTARSRITELEAHVSLQRETVETGQRYVSELESKLAAAEAMVEELRTWCTAVWSEGAELAGDLLQVHSHAEPIAEAARGFQKLLAELPQFPPLASRPSEQASKECPQCLCGKHPADPVCAACALENMASKAAELETQLAEAKAELEIAWEDDPQVPELKAKLEAAEAERAHLHSVLEAVRVIHPSTVAKVEAAAATEEPKYCEQFRDHDGRYDEICGRPMPCSEHSAKPQPHPQGARLGGPADKLRADICEAIRKRAPILAQVADELEWLAGVGTSG